MPDIRPAAHGDAGAVARIYEPSVRETAVSFEERPPSGSEIERRIERTEARHPWLVCEHDADVIGFAYAGPHRTRDAYRWSVDSSVYVDDRYHRRGVGRALYESLFAALELQGYYNVYAGTALPNPASVEFHRSMGFEPVGVYRKVGYKNGEWHDVQWWQRSLAPRPAEPKPPRPPSDVRGSSDWDDAIEAGLESLRLD
ncbi:arsinothricin resistance N-acetyltransferase ArsN1 family B [Natrononativus amylolyticus]|uniref:arsinothricin resistance N-acetyltransferase ArsN1 family B n=1 Tax=Natrononativus amylolyticus TaxID=2963434 RepID=UPI0020CCCC95|nr:arsinothricin resistance N-acetyltransferase ArsN1 family B [Natrononativus amylolyticus]